MRGTLNIINELFVDIYNDILKIEENAFKDSRFNDVSITEVHTIEAIGMYEPKSMGEVAKTLKITVGTLTVAVNNLVKKGYVERYRSDSDRRVVKIRLTKKGRLLYRVHLSFHHTMVNKCIEGFSEEQEEILLEALKRLSGFLKENYHLLNV
ncbi:MAG: MarR family transcriptional regulator [Firmicutes bacterium]|nr:MarR family transcriptional regulator [Bacillota bacterium]